jgi:phosphate transport system substrate-binding protein
MRRPVALCASVLFVLLFATPSIAGLTGRIVVAGYGPELPVMQDLGRAFEKAHPGTAIDFQWDRSVKAVELVKNGEAQVAVTDHADPALKTVPIAWDGIAVIVNFANPVGEVTLDQVKDLFTGKIMRWSELDGGDQAVEVLPRAAEDNVQAGLETSLGIAGQFRASGKPVRTDEKALRAVSGRDRAVSYLSMAAALRAQEDGIPIRILTVDKVEPGQPTVKSGAYKLRRPLLLLIATQPDPLTEAFVTFAGSPEGQRILQPTFVPYAAGSVQWTPAPAHVTDSQNVTPQRERS